MRSFFVVRINTKHRNQPKRTELPKVHSEDLLLFCLKTLIQKLIFRLMS
jgi:hypothetical protein